MKHFRLFLFLLLFSISSCQNESPSVYQSVKELNELKLLEFELSKMVQSKDQHDNSSWHTFKTEWHTFITPHGERNVVIELSKIYEMYIDLSQLTENDIIVDTNQNSITVNMPSVEDRFKELGKDTILYENKSGLIKISEKERDSVRKQGLDSLDNYYTEFKDKNDFSKLKRQAENKARVWLECLLVDLGYDKVNIEFKKDDISNKN